MEDDLMSPLRPDHYDVYSVCDDYDQYLRDVYTRRGKIGHDLTSLYSTYIFSENLLFVNYLVF